MKKVIAILVTVLLLGLIVFTLFKNKAEITEKAKLNPITSYPVSVVKVAHESLSENLSQVGVISANNDLAVVSEQQGKVTAVMVQEGSYVAAGSPLVRLDDLLAQANFMSVQTSYDKAKKDWERYVTLQKDGLISESELESKRLSFKAAEAQYITAKRQFRNAVITSPISGVVTSRPVNLGSMVNAGTVVANVVDISKFKVELNVAEEHAFKIKVGDPVTIETDVYPGVKFSGKIDFISAKADDAHTYPVQVVIPSYDKKYPLKSGMYGRVYFNLASQEGLVIPRDALVGSIRHPQVYVVEENKAKLRDLVIGAEVGTKLMVLQGLNEGETVVVNGQDNLKENIGVEIVSAGKE
ncbi:RND family efflux transporter MFP subunit [Hydrogenispora ethanolica]|jgi:RND family efflux transporter MFP subunit|uniref:RND family efflux transporter MFP subunit n=1 Tax=Hydrogenispora ethanolica TaxID=1082276 RepID=A0A4R1RXV7_HYDET|nr:efflux RND transporter periplasmic adaptor subunit [Hydrogenispora ethanolica]TCL71595.1 RND family efflux transporter MFP subunit [Hydrogenispora ethanolica]